MDVTQIKKYSCSGKPALNWVMELSKKCEDIYNQCKKQLDVVGVGVGGGVDNL